MSNSIFRLDNPQSCLTATLFAVAYIKGGEQNKLKALKAITDFITSHNELHQSYLSLTDLGQSVSYPDYSVLGFHFTVASAKGDFISTDANRIVELLSAPSKIGQYPPLTPVNKALLSIGIAAREMVYDWAFSFTAMYPTYSPVSPLSSITSVMYNDSYNVLNEIEYGAKTEQKRERAIAIAKSYASDVKSHLPGPGSTHSKLKPWADPTQSLNAIPLL